jgi:tight adherence protein C
MAQLLILVVAGLSGAALGQVVVGFRLRARARQRLSAEGPATKGLDALAREVLQESQRWMDGLLSPSMASALEQALGKAGWEGWSPGKFLGLQLLSGLGFLFTTFLLLGFGLPALVAALAGLGLPLVALHDASARRLKALAKALPDAMDLLTTCVEAGLSFDLGLQRVTEKLGQGPLKRELEHCLSQMRLGATRREALKELGRRAGLEELRLLVSALVQADQMGAPLGPALRAQSSQLRALRSQKVQKAAAQAPIKLLFPLMLFILPVVFLVLFGPIYLKWSQGGF